MFFSRKKEELDSITIKGIKYPVEIIYSKRRTVSIEVHPDLSIKIRSPRTTSIKYLRKNLLDREGWIEAKLKHFKKAGIQNISSKFNYLDGDEISFLGKIYEFKLQKGLRNFVDFKEETILCTYTRFDEKKIRNLFDKWYRDRAVEIISERMMVCRPKAGLIGAEYSGQPIYRKMKRRWGSCSSRGKITLNYELVKTPIECIDYVILHEFCHLKEMNHSRAFYKLMSIIMPEWKKHRAKLKQYIL